MLTLKLINSNPDWVIQRLAIKNFDASEIVAEIQAYDAKRKSVQADLDQTLAKLNLHSKDIGLLMREGKREEADLLKLEVTALKDHAKLLEIEMKSVEKNLNDLMMQLPNTPHESVPLGKSAQDNIVEKEVGDIPQLFEGALPHWDLAKKYDLIDFELGAKITGAGFPVYKGYGARLQRALINFFLDNARENSFLEIQPPYLINEESGYGTGNLPDKEGQMYHVQLDNLYLIPTAEIPVTNLYRDVIFDEGELPILNTAYSACFRREAGSYGKDVRGLNRLHQFDKVEIVCIEKPEKSYERLSMMVDYVQSLLEKLELPFRILRLCGGDMSFTSSLTFDFEVYSAAQKRWLEVSSVSNFEDFQANRMKCRYRDENRKTQLVHTLNGSALALPRVVAALLENNQTSEGIKIPKALVPYTNFEIIL